jgi:signal transduction histidine kinase
MLNSRERHFFTAGHARLAQAFANQAAVAIENARLFEQVLNGRERLKVLSKRLLEVQESERRLIAHELHDEIGQELTGLKIALEMNALKRGGESPNGLMEAQSVVNKLTEIVHELSLKLRPAMLDDLGLLPTLLWHFERFTGQTNIHVTFLQKDIDDSRFPHEVETAIYRIVQEALTNVARHARVDEVVVRLWSDEKALGVQIEDHGVGFDAEAAVNACRTNGLGGMRERAMLLGGKFTVEAQPGIGTRLTVELPVSAEG